MSNPICGACGNPLSKHFHEQSGVYCNSVTTGDRFTDEPSDEIVLSLFEEMIPRARESLVRKWKIANGHEVTA